MVTSFVYFRFYFLPSMVQAFLRWSCIICKKKKGSWDKHTQGFEAGVFIQKEVNRQTIYKSCLPRVIHLFHEIEKLSKLIRILLMSVMSRKLYVMGQLWEGM